MDRIRWLGQAGLLLEHGRTAVLVDPYLSDSVAANDPARHRRIPVDPAYFAVEPAVMVFTHNHLDHYDPETVARYLLPGRQVCVLAPASVWPQVRRFGGDNNYVLFNRHTVWTHGPLRFTAVGAAHSDPYAIGVWIEDAAGAYYITGDTLYNTTIFDDIPRASDVVFLPINGTGNNMNMVDAAAFARRIGARRTVPLHFGLFDDLRAEDFPCENKVIPRIYEDIPL